MPLLSETGSLTVMFSQMVKPFHKETIFIFKEIYRRNFSTINKDNNNNTF